MPRIGQSIAQLHIFGYSEQEILGHTLEWVNFHLAFVSQHEMSLMRLRESMRLQAAMLTGIMFNDPEKGGEVYEEMRAALMGDDDASDDAWMRNPNAATDVNALRGILQRRSDERSAERSNNDRSEHNGDDPNTRSGN